MTTKVARSTGNPRTRRPYLSSTSVASITWDSPSFGLGVLIGLAACWMPLDVVSIVKTRAWFGHPATSDERTPGALPGVMASRTHLSKPPVTINATITTAFNAMALTRRLASLRWNETALDTSNT